MMFTLETDAVMSTARAWEAHGPPDFQGPPGAHRTPRDVRCSSSHWTLPPVSRFVVGGMLNEKRTLPEAPADVSGLPNVAVGRHVRFRNFNPIPFRSTRAACYQTGFPRLLGSTNPCVSAVHMEPFPLRPSKFSFEYLLLPPRSAPTAAPPGLAPQVLRRPPRPPTHRGLALAPDGQV
ncbi:hypothetical protein K1719_044297 [Acacia pycnantha]|nr:hypothetical protein K1719_044297 [Acacia pycnantha]